MSVARQEPRPAHPELYPHWVTRLEIAADDPAAVLRIDWAFRRTPRDMGESRSPGFRLWYEDVLGVFYRLEETNLRVEILAVGPARQR